MLDYAQSFEEFSRSLKPVDLALYAGAAIILYVLFKDRLSPVQAALQSVIDKIKSVTASKKSETLTVNVVTPKEVVLKKEDVFFKLIASWKQTRDLAVESGCDEAVKVADQMFPYLSPTVCGEEKA